jgi:hypothetical protein
MVITTNGGDVQIVIERQKTTKDHFFRYLRRRLRNIQRLNEMVDQNGLPDFDADQHILLAALLDSSAKYWAETFGISLRNARVRMARFLMRHGTHAYWHRCSVVDLLGRTIDKDTPAEVPSIVLRLKRELDSRPSALCLDWTNDPSVQELAGLQNDTSTKLYEWLELSSYGSILYKYYRCSWLHTLDSHPMVWSSGNAEIPEYENALGGRRLALSKRFLLQEVEFSLNNFERAVPEGTDINLDYEDCRLKDEDLESADNDD